MIPEGVTSIGKDAFSGCTGLTSIVVDENNGYYDSRDDCDAIIETKSNTLVVGFASTVIPSSVTSIEKNAFMNCSDLTSIVIPEGVISIGDNAFYNCHSLTSFTCLAVNPPSLGSNAFYNVPVTIYVPAASVNAYKAADGWSNYASQIQAIQE